MAIPVERNENYGGTRVTQKYQPLDHIGYDTTDAAIYDRMLANRWKLLNGSGLLPQPLKLAVSNWGTILASEADKNPPLVVVSSNRSSWILKGINQAAAKLKEIGRKSFQNPSDITALIAVAGHSTSPPIYCPTRLGDAGARNVYIVVHMSEYTEYKRTLEDTGITVVGWEFRLPLVNRAPRKVWLSGFGASRFAAIEFCKELRSSSPTVGGRPPWDYAWLMDDNVVALTNFAGYKAVEKAMREAGGTRVAAGFDGGAGAESHLTITSWAKEGEKEDWGKQAKTLPSVKTSGILQQTVLWNIDYLTTRYLNFGPAFIASAEDVSLGKYFDTRPEDDPMSYLYYEGISVRKEETTYDDSDGGETVRAARERLTAWVTDMESANPPTSTPPPPIDIRSTEAGDRTLANFIVGYLLPHSSMSEVASNTIAQNSAKCQAVEQLICGGITRKYMSDTTLNNTFKINGDADQVIVRINKP